MIGALRYRIELLAREETPDEAGGAAVVFAPATEIWAAVELLASVSSLAGERTRRLRRIRALVRARPDAAIGARIRHGGVDYDVVSIETDDEKGRRVFLIGEEAA
ncbi:MAG: head-tail adaptor protein [Parvularculaceae bacterium]|nr:head-tail adaptor protein [Parvularculaceae bacterium]